MKENHFGGFLGPEALSAAKIADGFQQIGFSLGIVPHNEVYPGVEAELRFPVIAEMAQVEAFKIHERAVIS